MIKIGLKQEKLPQLNFGIKFFESVVVVFFGFFFLLLYDLLTLKTGICP